MQLQGHLGQPNFLEVFPFAKCSCMVVTGALTLSLPRVINFEFPLNIASHSMENLTFHSLLR